MSGGLTVAELTATLGLDDSGFSRQLDGLGGKFGPFSAKGVAAAASVGAGFLALTAIALKFAGEFDNAYDSIRIGTGATGKALDGLQTSFKNVVKTVPTDFASASTAITDLNQRLGLTGKRLETTSEQFLELSRITGTDVAENVRLGTRLFGDWSIATDKQAGTLDKIFRASQQSGIGITDLMSTVVEFGAPLRNMGFSFDDSIAMLSKWEKEGVNTSTVLTGMKFALKTFAKAGEDPQKALAETTRRIHDTTDAQAAMTLGMEVFGLRAGPDMVAAIREGRFQYGAFSKAIAGGSDTIMKAAKDTADWEESLTLLKNKALVALEPLLMRIFDGLTKAIDAFSGLSSGTQTALVALAAIVTVGGGAFVMLGKLAAAATALKVAFGGVGLAGGLGSAIPAVVGGGAAPALVSRGPGMLVTPAAEAAGTAAGAAGIGLGGLIASGVAAAAALGLLIYASDKLATAVGQNVTAVEKEQMQRTGSYSKAGSGGESYYKTHIADRRAQQDLVQNAILKLEVRGGGNRALNEAATTIANLREAADKGIDFTIDPKKPLASLQSIMARLEGTGMSAREAYNVMRAALGKDVTGPFRASLGKLPPAMDKAAAKVQARYAAMSQRLSAKLNMGPLDASNTLATIQSVYSAMLRLTGSANAAADAVARATTQHTSTSGGGRHLARGGVLRAGTATNIVFGEGGDEILAAFPMNDRRRSLELYDQLTSALMGPMGGGAMALGPTSRGAGASSAGSVVIHEHYHTHVPAGSVLVGTLDEAARVLSPHVSRHQERTAASKGRGR